MAIVQDEFYIPEDITVGLATGIYRRIGSVVRYAYGPKKGQIVKHLQPVELEAEKQAQNVAVKAMEFLKGHKKGAMIVAGGAVAIGSVVLIYATVKNHEPKAISEFQSSLRIYIDAIRSGNMDIDKINDLMVTLDRMKEHRDYEKIIIKLTTEEFYVLVNHIYKYTIKLAENNNVDVSNENLDFYDEQTKNTIVNLRSCLMAQKKIFESAA